MRVTTQKKQEINEINALQLDQIKQQPLWRRVNCKKIKQQDQIIQSCSQNSQIIQNFIIGNERNQPNVNEFLFKLHSKINDSLSVSQSQIIQQLSLDWQQDKSPAIQISPNIKHENSSEAYKITRTQKNIQNYIQELKKIKSIEEFLKFIKNINYTLYQQIIKILSNNAYYLQLHHNYQNQLAIKNHKINQLIQDINIMEQINIKLKQDLARQKKQRQKQYKQSSNNNLQKFTIMINKIKQHSDNRTMEPYKKADSSTNFSNSQTINQMRQTMLKDTTWENRPRTQSNTTPIKRKTTLLAKNNLSYRYMDCSNNKNCHCLTHNKGNAKDKEKDKDMGKGQTLKQMFVRPIFKSLLLQNTNCI